MKYLFIIPVLLITITTLAQTQITVQTQPEKAVVFLNGAQLYHSKAVQLAAGQTDIIIEGIPVTVDANSLQAGGKGDFTILDVQYRMQYPEPQNNNNPLPDAIQKKIKIVQDSIQQNNYILHQFSDQLNVLNYEKSMLLNSKLITGGAKTDSIELLKNAVDYYHKKLNEIFAAQLELTKKIDLLNLESNRLQTRLNELNNYWYQQNALTNPNNPIPQIVVSVNADQATSGTVTVNYVTYNAGWYATYDIRATEISKPVQLNYKANIWQNTGINWKNVKLTCSTGNPTLGNNLPELTTWYVGYYQEYYGRDYDDAAAPASTKALDAEQNTMSGLAKDEDKRKEAGSSANYTTPMQTIANVEFEINLSYSIPSDGKGHLVSLQSETLNSTYNYLIIPKVDQAAFLIARITDWENKNLLPGNANIYFNNTYVGKTYLDPLALNDTLSLSLGRDKSIEVKRTQIADKSTDKFIGLNNKKTMAYEIEVRNGKAITIEVIVKDQLPVSQDDDIKVELLEKAGGELDETTGIITWRNKLKTKEAEKYNLEFEITYPKNTSLGSL